MAPSPALRSTTSTSDDRVLRCAAAMASVLTGTANVTLVTMVRFCNKFVKTIIFNLFYLLHNFCI